MNLRLQLCVCDSGSDSVCNRSCVCGDRYLGIRGIDCGLRTPSFPSWQPVCVCVYACI